MKTITDTALFPCSICGHQLDVRKDKKGKPYLICDPCGMQMFVRLQAGIGRFEQLIADAAERDIWARLAELEKRYKKTCPRCGEHFWVTEKLIETSMFDGSFVGHRCPNPRCKGVVKLESEK